jgi:hypothetical protein
MTVKRHAISILVMLSAAKHPVIFHIQDITGSFRFQRQDDKVEDDEHQDDSQMHIVN